MGRDDINHDANAAAPRCMVVRAPHSVSGRLPLLHLPCRVRAPAYPHSCALMCARVCAHACTVQEVFLTQSHVCMAMEYAKGGDLYNYVHACGHLKEPVARCASGRAVHTGTYAHVWGWGAREGGWGRERGVNGVHAVHTCGRWRAVHAGRAGGTHMCGWSGERGRTEVHAGVEGDGPRNMRDVWERGRESVGVGVWRTRCREDPSSGEGSLRTAGAKLGAVRVFQLRAAGEGVCNCMQRPSHCTLGSASSGCMHVNSCLRSVRPRVTLPPAGSASRTWASPKLPVSTLFHSHCVQVVLPAHHHRHRLLPQKGHRQPRHEA